MTDLFIRLLNMSIGAGFLVIAVIILRLVWSKAAPKSLRFLLWTFVAVRLLVPISFHSTYSFVPISNMIPEDITAQATPTVNSGVQIRFQCCFRLQR